MGLTESNRLIARRYDRLAPVYGAVQVAFLMPPGLRRRAVDALALRPEDHVLEVGCGSGWNFPLLQEAVGQHGAVTGTDISPGMLRRAQRPGVTLLRQDAAELELASAVDAVLFSLSYSVMPNRQRALARAWDALRPGGVLVIMDAGAFGGLGRLLKGPSRLLSRLTVLGDPSVRPWEELTVHAPTVRMEFVLCGAYVMCSATKPAASRCEGVAKAR